MQKFSKWLIKEAISATAVDSVNKIVKSFLAKKLGTKVYNYPGVEEFTNSTGRGYGVRYFYQDKSIRFNWKGANINAFTLDSVDLWDGTSRDPNWHMEFDAQQSLVKTLPLIINFIQSPFGQGTFYLIPDDSKSTKTVKEEYLIEAQQIDAFDFVIKNLKPGAEISSTSLTAEFGSYKPYPVLKAIQNLYPQLFTKSGRKQVFSGTADDVAKIKAQKDGIIGSIGGVKIEVSKGGSKETYAPSEQESEIEAKGIEKVAYEEQLKHLSVLMRMVIKGATNALFIAGRGGTGKALPIDTPVLMSDKTWKAIGDIIPGDMVCSWDGSPTKVIGVYPQGIRETSIVYFSDGRRAETDNDHLWEVNHHRWKTSKILTTKEISALIQKGIDSRLHIPLYSDENQNDIDLPIDPWLLGFLIGDGSLTNGTTCFSSKDGYLIEKVKDIIDDGYEVGPRDNGCDYIIRKTTRSRNTRA